MAKILTENVFMVDHESGKPQFLLKGQEAPKWALDRLDDSQVEDEKKPAARRQPEGDSK